MNIGEFEKITGYTLSYEDYEKFEKIYNGTDLDKSDFVRIMRPVIENYLFTQITEGRATETNIVQVSLSNPALKFQAIRGTIKEISEAERFSLIHSSRKIEAFAVKKDDLILDNGEVLQRVKVIKGSYRKEISDFGFHTSELNDEKEHVIFEC